MYDNKEIKGKTQKKAAKKNTPCETCVYYDVIDEDGTLGCTIDFDEDEMYSQSNSSYYMGYGGSPVSSGSREPLSWENDSDWERN